MTKARLLAFSLLLLTPLLSSFGGDPVDWTIYITNDACSDYTWGFDEETTRRAFADLVRTHLDEMERTDLEKPENQSRYNMSVTQEALCFLERYPARAQEMLRRIRGNRLYVSQFLNNSLWGFQSTESFLRTLYPARRLERNYGIPMDVAEHIEEPALPWGAASLLAASGVKWLSVPFYDYDSTFSKLTNPPLFTWEGPDGARIRVVMDSFASLKGSYAQGSRLLRKPDLILEEWWPHYAALGAGYPLAAILASGTHSDTSPKSGEQAREFSEAIIRYNAQPGSHPKLINATLPMFCRAVDEAEARTPFLKTVRGCFGHSWDLWPVSLAKYAADMREGERRFLAAEALLAVAQQREPGVAFEARKDLDRAEWVLAMLADHAWNGSDDANKEVNAGLRRAWSAELLRLAQKLEDRGWRAAGLVEGADSVVLFNPLSVPRADLVCVPLPAGSGSVRAGSIDLPTQVLDEKGVRSLCFVSPEIPAYGFTAIHRTARRPAGARVSVRASPSELDSPFYRLKVNPSTGRIYSLVHKATGRELVTPGSRGLGDTVFFDGREHTLARTGTRVVASGPLFARLNISGDVGPVTVSTDVTVHAALDRVDFDIRIRKPVSKVEQRLTHVFPVIAKGAVLRLETTGAVIRPRPQPEGDLLPGADTRRFAAQGFVDASLPSGPGVTIAPLDAFALRLDLESLSFEALGNDQNYKEVSQDQHGATEFRFRYSLRAHAGPYDGAEAFAWSRSAATPLLVAEGSTPAAAPPVSFDSRRAIATAFKPADDPTQAGAILRLWETAGKSAPLEVSVTGFQRVSRTDLLERNLHDLPITGGKISVDLPAHGFAAVRLMK